MISKKRNSKKVTTSYKFRSKFESTVYETLCEQKLSPDYETEKVKYIQPAKNKTYTPDFILPKLDGTNMYLESKGYWPASDRDKMKFVKQDNPNLDIRIIFMNPNAKISKKSKTTYSMIADKLGFMWCTITNGIPADWLKELK